MLRPGQSFLSVPTDTANPVTVIPIFYVHGSEHPFCHNPYCTCHLNDGELKNLLLGVIDRKLKLAEVSNGAIQWEVR